MKFKFYILFQIITLNLFGQTNNSYQLTKDSDTLYYFRYEKPIIEKLKLIKTQENKNFFRFSSHNYYLELAEESNKYILYSDELWEGKKTGEIYIKEIFLNQTQINEINKLTDSLKLKNIPSSNQIKNWNTGFDGIAYKFEIKDENNYSFKSYWSPASQERFEESDKINFFVTRVNTIIEYQKNAEIFRKEIPFFSWTKDGVASSAVTILTKDNYSEYKKYRKLKKKQLKGKL